MRRSYIVIACVIGLLLVGGSAGAAWWLTRPTDPGPECTVPRPPGLTPPAAAQTSTASAAGAAAPDPSAPLTLTAVQLQHSSTINAVGIARGLPDRARIIAVATAWQESSMRNIDFGDRDSLGLFQQRPSQGWGEPEQLMDPVYAAGKFYDELLKVRSWQNMSLTEAAQAVQRSGHPDAYAKWEYDAATLVAELSGTNPPTLSCRAGAQPSTSNAPTRPQPAGAAAASPSLQPVLAALAAELGQLHINDIDTDNNSATVTVNPPSTPAPAAAHATAAWLVAHATTMNITEVRVGDRRWADHEWTRLDENGSADNSAAALPPGQVRWRVQPPNEPEQAPAE